MLKSQIKVGGHYQSRISGNFVTVRVDSITEKSPSWGKAYTAYSVTNLKTGRKVTFRSAAKFRGPAVAATDKPSAPVHLVKVKFSDGADREYTYDAGDLQLNIGDLVLVRQAMGNPTTATVTALESDYDGKVSKLLGKKECGRPANSVVSKCKGCGINIVVEPASAGPFDYCLNCSEKLPPTEASDEDPFGGGGPSGSTSSPPSGQSRTVPTSGSLTTTAQTDGIGALRLSTVADAIAQPASPGANGIAPVPVEVFRGDGGTLSGREVPLQQLQAKTGLAAKLSSINLNGPVSNAPHVIVQARAGCGKTTTLVEGLKLLKGIPSKLTPSPQQQAVWDAICQSKDARTVCFVAFNKSIATELQRRVPAGCDAMTMHSLGVKAVNKALGRMEVNQYVVQDIICELLGMDFQDVRRQKPAVLNATDKLVSLCKMNLTNPEGSLSDDRHEDDWQPALEALAAHYEVDLDDNGERNVRQQVFDLVPRVLERCKTPRGKINFDDMIWLPVVLGLPVYQYDLLLVDEAQDLNRCQQALAKRAGKRLILCGDEKQAIYGFAGADSESMKRMAKELGTHCDKCGQQREHLAEAGSRFGWNYWACGCGMGPIKDNGCILLPLTVTRRCGRAIVKEANKIVKDFQAHETCPDGQVGEALYSHTCKEDGNRERKWEDTYASSCKPGDMVLCRVNAPLVSQCFRFLRRGIKATIQGRDVGAGLVSTVRKLAGGKDAVISVVEFTGKLDSWLHKEQAKERAKKFPNDAKLIAVQDRHDCLACFAEGQNDTAGVISKIEAVFTDDRSAPGIRLSSGHKSKGLEADHVFILMPEGASCPHPMAKSAWQLEQEWNLKYVMVTRAIHTLTFVRS